jgi:hypothetical protein
MGGGRNSESRCMNSETLQEHETVIAEAGKVRSGAGMVRSGAGIVISEAGIVGNSTNRNKESPQFGYLFLSYKEVCNMYDIYAFGQCNGAWQYKSHHPIGEGKGPRNGILMQCIFLH